MAEYSSYNSKHDNKNFTDPEIVFDRKFEYSNIVLPFSEQNPADNEKPTLNGNPSSGQEQQRVDGIFTPILKVNNLVIKPSSIIRLELETNSFLPTITVELASSDAIRYDTPGMISNITLIILPPIDGAYKKISIDFHIDSSSDFGDSIVYNGTCYFPGLSNRTTKSVKNDSGNKLTTYELIETIAKECQLGFACTDKCKDVSDTKVRLTRNQTYVDMIKQHIGFGGIDNNSIFESWLDFRGNIVLINKAWVMSTPIEPEDLDIKVLSGYNVTDATVDPGQDAIRFEEQTRTFTNQKVKPIKDNMNIAEFEQEVNNSLISFIGNNNNYYVVNHLTNGGDNGIATENMCITEDSLDGENFKDAYQYPENKFIGVELAIEADGNTPVLMQEKRVTTANAKWDSRKLSVKLSDINFGIERGMLINVVLMEYSSEGKRMILNNLSNLDGNAEVQNTEKIEFTPEEMQEIISNEAVGIPNVVLSGVYYIDSMKFSYEDNVLTQSLSLIRKSKIQNLFNHSSLTKIS